MSITFHKSLYEKSNLLSSVFAIMKFWTKLSKNFIIKGGSCTKKCQGTFWSWLSPEHKSVKRYICWNPNIFLWENHHHSIQKFSFLHDTILYRGFLEQIKKCRKRNVCRTFSIKHILNAVAKQNFEWFRLKAVKCTCF